MTRKERTINRIGKTFAKAALKVGITSCNSACRVGYYQNKVPNEMNRFKK